MDFLFDYDYTQESFPKDQKDYYAGSIRRDIQKVPQECHRRTVPGVLCPSLQW